MNLEERFEKMETELKRYKRNNLILLAFILLGTTTMIVGAAKPGNIIKANGFILLDNKDRERAKLIIDKSDKLQLQFLDPNGKKVLSLESEEINTGLYMYDKKGSVKAGMSEGILGTRLTLSDENDNAHIFLSSFRKVPSIVFSDEKTNPVLILAGIKKAPGISLLDEKGMTHARIDLDNFGLMDENGKTRFILGSYQNAAKLLFYEPNGRLIWQVPPDK